MTTLGSLRERDDDYRSLFDPITGLPKRALLRDRLTLALARTRRSSRFVGLLSISVTFDGLRTNEGVVHALTAISIRLTSLLRRDDTAARVEDACAFILVCNDLTTQDQLDHIAERLKVELAQPLATDFDTVSPEIAITSYLAGLFDDDADQLLDAATRAAISR